MHLRRHSSRSRSPSQFPHLAHSTPPEVRLPPGLVVSISWNLAGRFPVLRRNNGFDERPSRVNVGEPPLLLRMLEEDVWVVERDCQCPWGSLEDRAQDDQWQQTVGYRFAPLGVHQHRRTWLAWYLRVGRAFPSSIHGDFWTPTGHWGDCRGSCPCCLARRSVLSAWNGTLSGRPRRGCRICHETYQVEEVVEI